MGSVTTGCGTDSVITGRGINVRNYNVVWLKDIGSVSLTDGFLWDEIVPEDKVILIAVMYTFLAGVRTRVYVFSSF